MVISVGNRVENDFPIGENFGYILFLHFTQSFQKRFISRSLHLGMVWY